MLSILNRYSQGYAVIPVILACKKQGLFQILRFTKATPFADLLKKLQANDGSLRVALRMLESLDWVARNPQNEYRLTPKSKINTKIPDDIMELTPFPMDEYLGANQAGHTLKKWIQLSGLRWNISDPLIADFLDGLPAIPLLLALKKNNILNATQQNTPVFSKLTAVAQAEIAEFFTARGWLTTEEPQALTDAGRFVVEEIFTTATVAAYKPMLLNLTQILFGDNSSALKRDDLDYELNAIGNRSLQKKYFADLEDLLLPLFNRRPYAEQPKYIADLSCEEGSLLPRIYEIIKKKSLRGAVLDEYPLEPIGADHKNTEARDPENTLHIRFFPDYDRSRLAEYFERWSRTAGRHGLILLARHCLDPKIIQQFINECENPHFDALHGFSQQPLAEAEPFLMAAAGAGLFPKNSFRKYPKTLPFSDITLLHLEKRAYSIRYAHKKDLPALERLEKNCWEPALRTTASVLQQRLKHYPQGQLVLETDGKIAGVIYSQRINSETELKTTSTDRVDRLHRDEGSIVQLLAVNIDPEVQERQFGDQLLEFMLQRSTVLSGIKSAVAVTLCRDLHKQTTLPIAKYIHKRNEQGLLHDPILRFHDMHGADIVECIAQYRPLDTNNEGFGVLVRYDIYNRRRREIQLNAEQPVKAADVEEFLEDTIKTLLGADEAQAFSKERPLMEMGLDSAALLVLSEQMSIRFQEKLEPAFFFEYSTPRDIAAYFKARRPKEEKPKNKNITPTKDANSTKDDGIAVIGMACRLPGGINTPADLWDFLKKRKNAVGPLPAGRWKWPANIDPNGKHPGIDRGGFLADIKSFDASFFRISPKEAEMMDPQQRILLELSWQVFEDAGHSTDALAWSNTGVFVGASGLDYRLLLEQKQVEVEAHMSTGNSMAVLANRISYFYDFYGPSLQIDTACSSSLFAVHEAVRALQSGECVQALVAGINVICHPGNTIAYYKAGMLSPDGLCKTFDEKANGYVRSEGAAALFLKPLAQAVADGDQIHAVIKGTSSNHGGQAGGLTVPNPGQQAKLLQAAWEAAGVAADSIGYIEAHGTGTSLGDPVEVRGLKKAFANSNAAPAPNSCALSSIKSNLGHLEAAAGIAGLLKVILSLKNRELPPSIHFKKLNSRIELHDSPFYIVQNFQDWPHAAKDPAQKTPRRAGVSSFGSGGANAHAVLEEYPAAQPSKNAHAAYLFVLSAKNSERLRAYAKSLLLWLEDPVPEISLIDFIYTLQAGRTPMEERLALIVDSFAAVRRELQDWLQGKNEPARSKTNPPGEANAKTLAAALAAQDLEQLALLWIAGEKIDWARLYPDRPLRISIPSYPFTKHEYWLPSKTKEPLHAPLLGDQTAAAHDAVFVKSWDSPPDYFFYTQDDFSCMSLGVIMEIFLAGGAETFPGLKITALKNFKYYPFHLQPGRPITYETRYFRPNEQPYAELVQIIDAAQILIAETELQFARQNKNDFEGDSLSPMTNPITFEEQFEEPFELPIHAIGCIFPLLINPNSETVAIRKVRFYNFLIRNQTVAVALTPPAISIFTKTHEPLLSIHQ